ncbi:MAG: hypothetical protein J6U68_02625, partial [Clostridia bacterium]|nr:hypothetical protein [Clostridia bacterium]
LIVALLAIAVSLCSCMVDLDDLIDDSESEEYGHECEFDTEVEELCVPATCTTAGVSVYECECGEIEEEIIPPTEHIPEIIPAKAPGCTENGATEGSYCKSCKTVLVQPDVIKAIGHIEVIDPATEAVGNTPAKTEGKHCSECGLVIVKQEFVFASDYSNPEKYDSDNAISYLMTLSKADSYKELYDRIDALADYFHVADIDADADRSVGEVDYSDLGISTEEALAVWSAYRSDRPLYYWISKEVSYTSDYLVIIADEEYKLGSERESINSDIYLLVEEIFENLETSTSYHTALAFHDIIISLGDYKYMPDGVTPAEDAAAHNITGILLEGAGVCESYAKSFELLLNFCQIENAIISGYAGEPHAWNAVKLDDGRWYWCDLTWDDDPDFMWGISHRYFMVTDSQDLSGQDGPWISSAQPFGASHIPDNAGVFGVDFAIPAPSISTVSYSGEGFTLRDEFTVDGLTFATVGYNTAALVRIDRDGEITVPATVEYLGFELSVIAVGAMENGLFKTNPIAIDYNDSANYYPQRNITKITLPESIIFIWDRAFVLDSLVDIEVDGDNRYFTSIDGVLFTKDLSVLVKYSSGRDAKSYDLPDETEYIAAGAFDMFYSNVQLELEVINLGENFILVGFANRGYGYDEFDEDYNLAENELETVKRFLSGSKTVE